MANTIISTNPARNYDVLGEVPVSSTQDVIAKVALARAAQKKWRQISLAERITHLENLAQIFKKNRDELIKRPMLEMGVPKGLATGLADSAEEDFAWHLAHAEQAYKTQTLFEDDDEVNELVYEPYGVMACIVAWNFPYPNFVVSVVQALLAGNTVVMKYSEEVPLFAQFLEGIIAQSSLPEGVVNFVYGDGSVGAALVEQDIDIISFTGSYATGQKLYQKAAEKFIPIINELGGSCPGVVFEDANIDDIVEDIFWGRFLNTAQFCNGLKRLIVHQSLFDECVSKLSEYAKTKIMGDPFNEDTELGPLVAERQVVKLEAQLKDALDKGAKVMCGGKKPENIKGAYFQPTILTDVKPTMKVWHEEVFGPVLPIVSFATYEEAMALANDTIYGLSGYVYTNDKAIASKALNDIAAGSVKAYPAHYFRPQNPFGGYKKSGMGRESGIKGFHDVAQSKVIARMK